MRRITTLVAALAALPLAALATPAPVGPPLVCFPWSIGNAPSLPWGGEAFEVGDLEPDRLASATTEALDASSDTLVHMETLRRAVVYATRFDERSKKGRGEHCANLSALVTDRSLRSLCEGNNEALAWLDLGYAREALSEMGREKRNAGVAFLEKAAALAPNDAAIRLALCGALLDTEGGEAARGHLDKALAAAKPGSLHHENALAYGKRFRSEGPSKKASH